MELNPNLSEKGKHDYALILRATEESDQKAYAELMERYRDSIFHLCRKMVFNDDDADDLTIETFGKAFQRLNQYTPAFAFSTWLFKIASNHCIDFIRKKRINALSLDRGLATEEGGNIQFTIKDDAPDPIETLEKKQRVEKMRLVVSELKPRYRKLVELRYFEEYSYDEIALELDLPLGTVKAQLYRARDILTSVMESSKKHL
ncbi:MAG: sigma-70 family RNA polymerase sigma factor [Bacteroidetes bacterium]|jgi:RNA polymerase sigma factor (sigma-70 family)|nr:sigma-70 family RNA polymerase sigma factor [Bacteroidota bacterium]MDA0732361.1 sigma-70 family RNA polymerase sigma factor [Bacteroidota bacterium]MDA0980245.1 sigma-70 family RNA polymerase sigma factor [Bacteroidota bacterium]